MTDILYKFIDFLFNNFHFWYNSLLCGGVILANLIDKKERNLLMYSNYIKNSNNLNSLITILIKNETIDYRSLKNNNELLQLIINNKNLWLDMSRAEWKLRKIQPKITNKSDDKKTWKKCSLCKTINKHEYYIVNKLSKRTINIGGECVKKFLGDEIGSISKHILKNPKAAALYEDLQIEYPIIKDILFNDSTYLAQSKYILPLVLSDSFISIRKRLVKILNNYLSGKSKQLDQNKFKEHLFNYSEVKNQIMNFNDKSSKEIWSCSIDLKRDIERIQPDSASQIVELIEKHNGLISFSIAPKIQVESFLNTFMAVFNVLHFPEIKIKDFSIGKITFTFNDLRNEYNFSINSSIFIGFFSKQVFSIRDVKVSEFTRKFYDQFTPSDSLTFKLLEQLSEIHLEEQFGFKEMEINYKLIFKSDIETDYKYTDRTERIEKITNNLLIYQKQSSDKVYVFDRSDLSTTGMALKFNSVKKDDILDGLLSRVTILTQSNFYQYLRKNVYAVKMSNL